MNRNQVKGRVTKATGRTKAAAGKLLRKPSLAAKGRLEEAAGMVQLTFGDLQSAAEKGARRAKRTARRSGKTLGRALGKASKAVKKKTAARKAR
jgi:uncharacterized protein YjbJ (UPF0337 family)